LHQLLAPAAQPAIASPTDTRRESRYPPSADPAHGEAFHAAPSIKKLAPCEHDYNSTQPTTSGIAQDKDEDCKTVGT